MPPKPKPKTRTCGMGCLKGWRECVERPALDPAPVLKAQGRPE